MFGLQIWRWEHCLKPDSMLEATGVDNSCPPLVTKSRPSAHTMLTTLSRLQIGVGR